MRPITITLATALTACALLGCGASVSGVAVPDLPTDFSGPGVYTVPGVPAAPFSLAAVRIEQSDGTVSVYYDLPAQLVGKAAKVELTGAPDSAGELHLSGDAGTSTCTVTANILRCDERLFGVHVDGAEASAELPEGDPRRAAVQAFMVDPIGILRVALPSGK